MKQLVGALGVIAAAGLIVVATAVEASAATLEWGDAVAQIGENIKPTVQIAVSGIIGGLLLKFGGPFGMMIKNAYVDQLVNKAVDYGFAATLGAQRGKTLTLEAGNSVLGKAVGYAEGHFPWVLRTIVGGATKLIEMAIARMPELPVEYQHTPTAPATK